MFVNNAIHIMNAVFSHCLKSYSLQVKLVYSKMEKKMFGLYESQGPLIQRKLAELYATLDRISKLEGELEHFKSSLGLFYKSVAQQET